MTEFENQIGAVEQLSAWANNPLNSELLGAHALTVQKKLRNTNLVVNRINKALSLKPTIGIYGPSQAGKSYLTAKFAENRNGKLSVNMDKEYDFLRDINPSGGRESTALVSRFSTDTIQKNKDYPIQAKLLSEAEIVCILANSYFCDNDEPVYPNDDQISEILSGCDVDISSVQHHNEEALLIEHYLEKKILPRNLKGRFANLWVAIANCYENSSLEIRARVYSILWNLDENFSNLFVKLATSLESLQNSNEVLLPIASLLPREASIIDVNILKSLTNSGSGLITVLSNNKEVQIERAIISALISELFLQIVNPQRDLFEKADLLDFPGARTRFEKSISNMPDEGINEFFLRGKIDFLFHKFTIDLAIDALVFCIDPGPMNIKELPRSLEDWIELSEFEGSTEQPRLFFTLTKFDTHFPDAAGNTGSESDRFENALDSGLVQPFAKNENSWLMNWKQNKFSNVFPLRNPNYPLEGYFDYKNGIETKVVKNKKDRLNDLKNGFISSNLVNEHIGSANEKWDDLVTPNGGGVNFLAQSIEELDLIKLKKENLKYQMTVNADAMIETLGMFIQSDSATERLEKERDKFKSLFKSINAIGQSGKYNFLIKTLSVSQDLIKSAIKQAIQNVDTGDGETQTGDNSDDWTPDFIRTDGNNENNTPSSVNEKSSSSKIVDALLASWVHSLTSGYDGIKIKQLLNTDMASFEFITTHLAHEVQIAKIKNQLETKFDKWNFGQTLDSNVAAFSKIANEAINSHVILTTNEADNKTVVSETVSEFMNNQTAEPLQNWRDWINLFTKKIEENCEVGSNQSVDPKQNKILSAALEELKIA